MARKRKSKRGFGTKLKHFLRQMADASTKKESYGKAYKEPVMKSFKFALSVILLGTFIAALQIIPAALAVPYMAANVMPDFTIQDGVLTIDAQQPLEIGDERSRVIIDTTDTSALPEGQDGVLVGSEQIITRDKGQETVFEMKLIEPYVKNNADLKSGLTSIMTILGIMTVFFLFFGMVFNTLFVATIFSLVAFLLVLVFGGKMRLSNIFKVTFYAMTPYIILSMVFVLPFGETIGTLWTIALMYLVIRDVYKK